jgi:energy-converting hydrogenase Eha subunit E
MESTDERIEQEMMDLKQEIENFKREKDRVRSIVGQIGGMPTFNTKLINIFFILVVVGCVAGSLFSGGIVRLLMIELVVAAVSIKLIYLIFNQSRVNHFQLWVLTSLEWRLNEIIKLIKELKEQKGQQ